MSRPMSADSSSQAELIADIEETPELAITTTATFLGSIGTNRNTGLAAGQTEVSEVLHLLLSLS